MHSVIQSITPANRTAHSKLASISQSLSDIGARIKDILQEVSGAPANGPRPLSGPGSRLTDAENAQLLRMFKQTDRYTVQQIADHLRISRAGVYLAARTAGLTERTREPSTHQAYPLEHLLGSR